jgi:hypothetical protein
MNIFITGLPRSGSTLLFNLLSQNPELNQIAKSREWGMDETLPDLLRMNSPKIIITYRPILEVLASFVQLANKYPESNFIDKSMIEHKFLPLSYRPINDARCDWLMRPYGPIDEANTVFKNMGIYKEWFYLVNYDDLCSNTEEVLSDIYKFLEIDNFAHDLNNIPQHDNSEDMEAFGIPTLHTIKPVIQKSTTNPNEILSEYVIQKYSNAMDFFTEGWLQSEQGLLFSSRFA